MTTTYQNAHGKPVTVPAGHRWEAMTCGPVIRVKDGRTGGFVPVPGHSDLDCTDRFTEAAR